MKQFKAGLYEGVPPFACCLYHREVQPRDESFLEMLRFTFLPYFELYSLSFFWIAVATFVFICSLYTNHSNTQEEFLRVQQGVLFELGENYPYYIVKKYHYYRLFTSIVLFRNLYHFLMAVIGIAVFASYIEMIVGFKRTFLLSIISGVGGLLIRNVFLHNASLESLTPIFGLVGYIFGFFLANKDTNWKYNHKEKVHMMLIILMVVLPYVQLGVSYGNISLLSMAAGFLIGFAFYLCDPNSDRFIKFRLPAIIGLVGAISVAGLYFFFKTSPEMIEVR